MNLLEQLMQAGEGYGLERRSPAAQADQPMTDTTSRAPQARTKPSAWNNYVSGSLEGLSRIPRELARNVGDLVSRYGPGAAQVGAGMLPGAGMVEAPKNYQAAGEAFGQGNIVGGLAQGAMGIYNQATDFIPGTPTLAAAALPAATKGARMADLTAQYARPQGVHSGNATQFANVKSPVAYEDMTRTVREDPNNQLTPWKEADLESMIGGYGFPLVGDRTEAGQILSEVNGRPLAWDVNLEGGYQYGQGAASRGPDRSGWASHEEPIKTLDKRVAIAHNVAKGAPVYGIYSGMAERSGDFSTMNADALLGLVPGQGMSSKNMADFDAMLRARLAKDAGKKGPANWPGLEDLEGSRAALLARSGGDLRKAFMETADKRSAQDLGMPDTAGVRVATTAPFLRDWTGSGATGASIVRLDKGSRRVTDPAIPHGTYPHQFPGEYIGGMPTNVDRNEFFPGTVGEQFAIPQHTGNARTWANVDRAFMTNPSLLERFDREWFDNVMAARERRMREGQ